MFVACRMLMAVCLLVIMFAFVLVFVFLCHILSPSFIFALIVASTAPAPRSI
jgi:hypothetical protein